MTDIGEIPSIASYNVEMRKSMMDKSFYLDKIDADVIVDFGCADGSSILFWQAIFPEKHYLGYDINEAEIELAKTNVPKGHFFSSWSELTKAVEAFKSQGLKTAVTCNSLIHEVYTYSNAADIQTFWDQIFSDLFDYVVIRDMSVSRSVTRQSDSLSVLKVRQRFDPELLNQFEIKWGSITENWALVHFLLKYRYITNWRREVEENYLPLNYEDLVRRIPNNWNPIFHEHFVLPFIRQQVQQDFNIDLQDRTHVKLILKKSKVDATPHSV